MPRGGKRKGSGAKPKWNHGKTKQIRVPEILADQVLELTEMLDNGYKLGRIDNIDTGTDSKIINLSGLSIWRLGSNLCVLLGDLVNKGYQILPESLANKVIDDLYASQIKQANRDAVSYGKKGQSHRETT